MIRFKVAQLICSILPPIMAQSVRNLIYPFKMSQIDNFSLKKKSFTGSFLEINSSDFHGYPFAIHGYFDWRNVIVAKNVYRYFSGDIIEVGANIGTETIGYCDIVHDGHKVHAFEPLKTNLNSLEKIRANNNKLQINPKAVSNKVETVKFSVPPKNLSGIGHILHSSSVESDHIEVSTCTLDEYMTKLNNVTFVSIDAEGHEPLILSGAKLLIQKFRPVFVIEVSPKLLKIRKTGDAKGIHSFFTKRSYICYNMEKFGLTKVNGEDTNIFKSGNWICIPKEKLNILSSLRMSLLLRAVLPFVIYKK